MQRRGPGVELAQNARTVATLPPPTQRTDLYMCHTGAAQWRWEMGMGREGEKRG